jgi:hypothetical protein
MSTLLVTVTLYVLPADLHTFSMMGVLSRSPEDARVM